MAAKKPGLPTSEPIGMNKQILIAAIAVAIFWFIGSQPAEDRAPAKARQTASAMGHAATTLAMFTSQIQETTPEPVEPVAPVGPVTPADCTNCATSDWPGWLGDGQPRIACPVCNADGKVRPAPRAREGAPKKTMFWKPKPSDLIAHNNGADR